MTGPAINIADEPAFPAGPSVQTTTSSPDFTLREMLIFFGIGSTILLSANALLCATVSYFFGLPGWMAWQVFPGALAVAFIPATILRFRSSHSAISTAYALSAVWLGALNFGFFAAIGCWIAKAAFQLAGWPLPPGMLAGILFGAAFLATIYGLINARSIRVSRVTVRLTHLPEVWRGRTAALITDLHLGPIFGAAFLRRVIHRLRSLRPDAVFISGDMFDGTTLGVDELVEPWRYFSARRGIYYVTGNHDEFAERNFFIDAVKRTGVRVLNNEKLSLDGLQVIGVHDTEAGDPVELRSILRQAQIDPQYPAILLAHRPVNLAVAEEEGVSLQLSGHTHGGQFWPWNLAVSRVYGRFASGLSRLGRLQVFTSNGVGAWGPPVRVATKSEIVLIRFEDELTQD